MKLAYISQLCSLTATLIEKNRQFLDAMKKQKPRNEIIELRKEMADLHIAIREARRNIKNCY